MATIIIAMSETNEKTPVTKRGDVKQEVLFDSLLIK